MLRKLLKYEYKATVRNFAPIYLAVLLVTAMLAASILLFGTDITSDSRFEAAVSQITSEGYSTGISLMLLSSVCYVCLFIAMFVILFLTICQRFYKNLLGSEGYLMHTLPVNPAMLIASKVLVSLFWSALSALALVLSLGALLLAFWLGHMDGFSLWNDFLRYFELDAVVLWSIPSGIASFIVSLLSLYLAMLIGHQVKKGHLILSVIVFFVLDAFNSWVTLTVSDVLFVTPLQNLMNQGKWTQFYFGLNALSIGYALVFIALYFVAMVWLLRNRLNLE